MKFPETVCAVIEQETRIERKVRTEVEPTKEEPVMRHEIRM